MWFDRDGFIFTKNLFHIYRFPIRIVLHMGYRSIRHGTVHLHIITSCSKLLNKPKKLPLNISCSNKRLIKPFIKNPRR